MIDPVTEWFEITQYNNKKAMTISKVVETTWLVQYPWCRNHVWPRRRTPQSQVQSSLIEQKYAINTNPASPWNPQAKADIEIMN